VQDCGDRLPPPPPPPLPGVLEMTHSLAEATRYLAEIMTNSQHQERNERREGCSSESFFKHNSPVFTGHEGPREADSWFETTQKLMLALNCTDAEMVNYGGLKLVGEASKWWDLTKASLKAELVKGVPVTWAHFKEKFYEQYVPHVQRQLWAEEFLTLTQGNMTVAQYSTKFIELSRYGPTLIPNDQAKAEKFLDGLSARIKEKISIHEIKEYPKAIHAAMIAEQAIEEVAAEYVQKKRSMPEVAFSPKRQNVGGSSSEAPVRRNIPPSYGNPRNPPCSTCRKSHLGVCRIGTNSCYRCGKTGHYVRECPMATSGSQGPLAIDYQPKQPTQACVYSFTPGNVPIEENNANVVTGTISLYGSLA
jgi:hypothetical protein